MASQVFLGEEGLRGRCGGHDLGFTEVINQQMRVPERLRVAGVPLEEEEEEEEGAREDTPPSFSMHIPDRISLSDAPDLSPRPLFLPHPTMRSATQLNSGTMGALSDTPPTSWDRRSADRAQRGSLRRSFSDCTISRSPLAPPSASKQRLHLHPLRRTGPPQCPDSPPQTPGLPPSLLSPQSVLRSAQELGQQATQRLLQIFRQKYNLRYSFPEHAQTDASDGPPSTDHIKRSVAEQWQSPEAEEGGAVEVIVLRRQVSKMSRRLAGLERQNIEHRRTELLLFSLLLSACVVNSCLWLRR
ncbi:mitochondrial fission factor homolog A isoform X1 [Amia ocellicauda]|uniref:mitochondrial fission factor homolog A isoform X1 n=1 Tax=Amia ocellicauda TaxID=2972642 RepID=UPI0034641DE3